MIEAKQLSKSYGGQIALQALDMNIKEGEIFALLGQNGAGKTTTINCFLGFVEPTSGEALIHGVSVSNNPLESKQYLAYIPETVMLYPNLSGIENLAFFSSLAGQNYSEEKLKGFLSKSGLQESAQKQRVGGYSKGMRQKVGIAIALAKKAKALFLDEPTSGLDPKASNEFSEILKELSGEGTAILMATHDIFRAKEVAHRIGIMKEGQLVSELNAVDISANELEMLYLKTI
ncbi:ABC transporter ATP-binding protein [Algoriphagus sp.]|jgi:ABC-2 type transport system ATP-binding protein|uniref:ABC transporter ATP-binding protein n=1 Tax=Algoriphagus sp. TaxID=1872435 RepID=UPI00271FDE34|nr:ABC transporter ATP-binding protein [Algoriphagus sp.]MDO8966891.1 ABC transporter ATP-binding protein [Algoriphagus sp.]MDP3199786.1 ABC transporter ATP-binding protein [Algoriphagus sp.]